MRQVVPDKMLLLALVARTGGVAVHRLRVVTTDLFVDRLRVEEFPLPAETLGIDMVWNPRLADEAFVAWLRTVLRDAVAEL